jgi:hypothetical protein
VLRCDYRITDIEHFHSKIFFFSDFFKMLEGILSNMSGNSISNLYNARGDMEELSKVSNREKK